MLRFRDDIDPANTWLVSDTHFGHENIVGFCHRPEDHEQVILAEWRAHVPDDATVIHVGDLCYRNSGYFKHIISKELTGERKLLIKGNHDRNPDNFYARSGFKLARPFGLAFIYGPDGGLILNPGVERKTDVAEAHLTSDYVVSFSHYPWGGRNEVGEMPYNHLRVHGHIHNNGYSRDAFVPFLKGHVNISVEQTKYRPINMKLLLDGVLLGRYPETTDEQREEAAARKAINMNKETSS